MSYPWFGTQQQRGTNSNCVNHVTKHVCMRTLWDEVSFAEVGYEHIKYASCGFSNWSARGIFRWRIIIAEI